MIDGKAFNQLVVFHVIKQEGSISKAAKKLEMAIPSVSASLKKLENNIGLPLFNRTTRRIDLTEAGQLLYDKTVSIVEELNCSFEEISDLSKVPSGKVRLTIPRFVYQYFIKPIYTGFCFKYPLVELEISISDATVDILSEGYDVGIRFGDKVEEGMIARPLTKPLKEALIASSEYITRCGEPKTPKELSAHKLIQYRFKASNKIAPLYLEKQSEKFEVDMNTALIVNDTDLMVDATENGLGIGRIVEHMVEENFRNKTLRPIMKSYWSNYSPLYVYFHRNSQKAKRVRVLIDYLIEEIQER